MRSNRSSNRLNLSSHAKVRSTRMRNAWIASLNSRLRPRGIHLRRDNPASVRYAKELDSNKSSATLQRTDRHGILGQKPCDFQLPLWQRQAKHSTTGPSQRVFQEDVPATQTTDGMAR